MAESTDGRQRRGQRSGQPGAITMEKNEGSRSKMRACSHYERLCLPALNLEKCSRFPDTGVYSI